MPKVSDLFHIIYGNKFDLNKMTLSTDQATAVNFVGRSSQNHGVSAQVERIQDCEPFPDGLITVALGGSKLLSSFVQERPFYTAQNVAVLKPKSELSFSEKIYYCMCIRHNRFRYSAFGREANRTLKALAVPAIKDIPGWINSVGPSDISNYSQPYSQSQMGKLQPNEWRWFRYDALFEIKKGKRILNRDMIPGKTPCVRPIAKNNGITKFIAIDPNHEGNVITVSYNGSVGEAFYQPVPIFALDDINILYPKFDLTPSIAMFLITLIRKERYRFNYGRKWHLGRMNESLIRLPVDNKGNPDWKFMENYIKSLPYSKELEETNGKLESSAPRQSAI
jgi:hypothetical protein